MDPTPFPTRTPTWLEENGDSALLLTIRSPRADASHLASVSRTIPPHTTCKRMGSRSTIVLPTVLAPLGGPLKVATTPHRPSTFPGYGGTDYSSPQVLASTSESISTLAAAEEDSQSVLECRLNEGMSFSSISASQRGTLEWIGRGRSSSYYGWEDDGMEEQYVSLERLSSILCPQEGLKVTVSMEKWNCCSLCSRNLSQRPPWSSQRLLLAATSDLPSVAVLSCGHVYHADCLDQATPQLLKHDPACPECSKEPTRKNRISYMGRKLLRNRQQNNSRIGVLMDCKISSSRNLNGKAIGSTENNNNNNDDGGNWGTSLISAAFGSAKTLFGGGHSSLFKKRKSSKDIAVLRKPGSPARVSPEDGIIIRGQKDN